MNAAFDTNVLVYSYGEGAKSSVARDLVATGGLISVQNLNEFANVAIRKLRYTWAETEIAIQDLLTVCGPPVAMTLGIHTLGMSIAREYQLSVYDALIVAAALTAECDVLYSEDMHHGLVIDGRLRIVNPFA